MSTVRDNHSVFHMSRTVEALIQKAAARAELPTQAELAEIAKAVSLDAVHQSMVRAAGLPSSVVTAAQMDFIIRGVRENQDKSGKDHREKEGDARQQQTRQGDLAGFLDRYVTASSENFHDHQEQVVQTGTTFCTLDLVFGELGGPRGVFDERLSPRFDLAIVHKLATVHETGARVNAAAAA